MLSTFGVLSKWWQCTYNRNVYLHTVPTPNLTINWTNLQPMSTSAAPLPNSLDGDGSASTTGTASGRKCPMILCCQCHTLSPNTSYPFYVGSLLPNTPIELIQPSLNEIPDSHWERTRNCPGWTSTAASLSADHTAPSSRTRRSPRSDRRSPSSGSTETRLRSQWISSWRYVRIS